MSAYGKDSRRRPEDAAKIAAGWKRIWRRVRAEQEPGKEIERRAMKAMGPQKKTQ